MWTKIIFTLFFFFLEYLIICYFFYKKSDLFYWILFYYFQSVFLILILHFNWGKNFFFLLLKDMNKNIIIRDPQDLLYLLMNSSFYLILIISFGLIFFYLNLKISNLLRNNEYTMYKVITFFFLYSFILSLLIFIFDLNSFHWEIFYQDKTFDFQPELTKWYFFYKGEFFDLLFWLFIIFFSYFFSLLYPKFFFIQKSLFFRLIPFLLLFSFSIYFLGGESLFRDSWLCFLSFFIGELFIYSKLCFLWIHKYKSNLKCS